MISSTRIVSRLVRSCVCNHLGSVFVLVAVACEASPKRYGSADGFELCGAEFSGRDDLLCGAPVVAASRISRDDSDVLVTLGQHGNLAAFAVERDELGSEIVGLPVSTRGWFGATLLGCDLNANGIDEVLVAGALGLRPFVLWDLESPGADSAGNGLPPWEADAGLTCLDLDGDGFSDLLGFAGGTLQVVHGGRDGYRATSEWVVPRPGYDGALSPVADAVRPQGCDSAILAARPIILTEDAASARVADVFELSDELTSPGAIVVDGDIVGLSVAADPQALLMLLWVVTPQRAWLDDL